MPGEKQKYTHIECRYCGNDDAYLIRRDEKYAYFSCDHCGFDWKRPNLKTIISRFISKLFGQRSGSEK